MIVTRDEILDNITLYRVTSTSTSTSTRTCAARPPSHLALTRPSPLLHRQHIRAPTLTRSTRGDYKIDSLCAETDA
jgi:hypothetical protein